LFDQCGIDPQAGARPMRRLVKMWVEDTVADFLISNRGGDVVDLRMIVEGGRPVVRTTNEDAVTYGRDVS
jgi:ATP-dependent Clp protease ATP-binding subunit ClpA